MINFNMFILFALFGHLETNTWSPHRLDHFDLNPQNDRCDPQDSSCL